MYSDFRDVVKGPTYEGPDEKTVIQVISSWGQRSGCRFEELRKEFGPDRPTWKETLDEIIARAVSEGRLTDGFRGRSRWIGIAGE